MNSENGLIGLAWDSLREAWFSEYAKRLIVIDYEKFVHQPDATIKKLYEELQEPVFEHDFNNVIYDEPNYDAHFGMLGLHKVQQKVKYRKRESCIPPDIFVKYADENFWAKPEMNRGATVL